VNDVDFLLFERILVLLLQAFPRLAHHQFAQTHPRDNHEKDGDTPDP
jgi:hypothetical protein